MDEHVLGFVQDQDGQRVLLVEKLKPEYLKGQLHGVGGKIEPGEKPEEAMSRVAFEACELDIPHDEWILLGHWGDQKTLWVHVFGAVADLNFARSTTDERLMRLYWHELGERKLGHGVEQMLGSIKPK